MHGWQSESTDGPKVAGVLFFGVIAMVAVVLPPQLLDVVRCSPVVVVAVVAEDALAIVVVVKVVEVVVVVDV